MNKADRCGQGAILNETPLQLNVRLQEGDLLLRYILSSVGPLKANAKGMVATIVANFRMNPNATIFYSRDRSYYSKRSRKRYFPKHFTYSATLAAVAALARNGFIEDLRTLPSPRAKLRSRLRATLRMTTSSLLATAPLEYVENETIVLRRSSKSKEQIDYVDTDEIRAMRADVQAQNAFLRHVIIGLPGGTQSFVEVDGKRFDLSSKLLYRVFNGDFEHGGRWYGPVWQNLPKHARTRLTIDGCQTCELDYSACQPRLLCANAGLQLPFDNPVFDFYRMPGFERKVVKSAFHIILNASSLWSARHALIDDLREMGIPEACLTAQRVCKAMISAWPQLATYWFTGVGLRLQRIDADICARVQAQLRAQGVPALSIHDGFIVRVHERGALQLVMDVEMEAACSQLRARPLDTRSSHKA